MSSDINKKNIGFFLNAFSEVFRRLPYQRKKQFWFLFLYMIFASIIATVTAGVIALFAATFSSPEKVFSAHYIVNVRNFLQLDFLNSAKGFMIAVSSLMVFFVAIKNIVDGFLIYCIAHFCAAVEAYFGFILFRGFIHMPYEWHLNRNSADVILAIGWRAYIGSSLFNTALRTMSDVFLVLFLVSAVFLANPYMSLVVFTLCGSIAYIAYSNVNRFQEREAEKCKEFDLSINRHVTKGIHGVKDVKVSGASSFLIEFNDAAYRNSQIRGMRNFFCHLPVGLLETVGFLVLSGSIVFMLFFTKASSMEVTATISLLIVAAWKILPATSRIMAGFIAMRNISPYIRMQLDHIKDIELNAVYAPEHNDSLDNIVKFEDEIRLNNLSFAYQNKNINVLDDISFWIKKGQTVGIVGYSGAGKSTLVDILIGLLPPNEGKILVDGCELDEKNRFAWMKKVGYVSQSPYICDGSIAENIAFGIKSSEIDREYVTECCKMAYLQDVIDSLPQGIETVIGERGVRLSGGQRQRVAIARALYTKPELMIFDEATSSLDSKSEKAIQNTISLLKGKKTLIVIAHRLQTVENCDALIWLESGRIKMFDNPKSVLCEYEESLR